MRYKLSDYAKKFNVTYRTAWNRYKAGKIDNCKIDDTGHEMIYFKWGNVYPVALTYFNSLK